MTAPLDTAVIDGAVALLSEPGVWMQGDLDVDDRVCAHGAVLRQHCTPGDEHLWRQVMNHKGLTEAWNDENGRDADDVIAMFSEVRDVTRGDMAAVFGPNWEVIRDLVRRAAILTDSEITALVDAWDGVWRTAGDGVWRTAWWWIVWRTARDAARGTTLVCTQDAARGATQNGAWRTVRDATGALIVRDLISSEDYATLTGPWASVIGPVHPDDVTEARP